MNLNETTKDFPLVMGDPPESNSKEMFRPAVEYIRMRYDNIHESIRMAELMDGSGECGKFIWMGYEDDLGRLGAWVELRFNVDLEELEDWLHDSARKNDEYVKEPYYHSDKVHDYTMVREINELESW